MKAEQLIYDTRRVPAWLGIPLCLVGIGCLLLAAHIACSHLLGFKLLPTTGESGSPALGFLGTVALGFFFLSVPFMRNRIFYDRENNGVLVRHRGLFGRAARRLPLGSATGVEIQVGHGAHGGVHWHIWIQLGGSRREWLTQLGSVDEAEGVGRSLSEAARLPLLKT
jgi:LPXTG-motif cell wall-anchored protein